ncbi:MAG: thiamine-phosphate kinase [Myxococcota bacterium]
MRVRDVGEFGLIERIARLAQPGEAAARWVARGIGEDAAILRARAGEDLVLTTDAMVEDVHFRWRSMPPRVLGRRLLAASLSDLAATGARARGCLLSVQVPPALPVARLLGAVRGLVDDGRRLGCPLVGGNVARADRTSFSVTAAGSVASRRALSRSRARSGDRILVTGVLGRSALERARAERRRGRIRSVPESRIAAGRALGGLASVGACIDVSDGLLADLGHVLTASGVGADLDLGRVPRPRGFPQACLELGLDPARLLLAGGEDYELLFTLRPRGPSGVTLARRLGAPVAQVGVVTPRGLRVRTASGWLQPRTSGWRHF